jgi:DNA-cytosine methyltransferase
MSKQLTQINLFSGIGGASEGLSQAGYKRVTSVEWNPGAAKIHDLNHETQTIVKDITQLPLRALPVYPDLFWASPSCQKFSLQNRQRGETANDFALAQAVVDAIHWSKPGSVVIENVPSYLTSQSFKIIRDYLDSHRFTVDCKVVEARDYGNPSARSRLICRANANGLRLRPLEDFKQPWKSVWSAFADNYEDNLGVAFVDDLKEAEPLAVQIPILDNLPKNHGYIIERRGYYGSPKYRSMGTGMACIKSATHHDMKPRKNSDSPIGSYCVAYNFYIHGKLYTVEPKHLGVLMGFSIDYNWGDNKAEAAAGIGNAVPVGLAKAVGLSLID